MKKTLSLQRMILFIESFTNVKRFGFQAFIRVCEILNETKNNEKVLKFSISVGSVLFQIYFM